jgi:RNA polymerase sigma factor (sigma-70 family)
MAGGRSSGRMSVGKGDPCTLLEKAEMRRILGAAVARLKEPTRRAIEEAYLRDRPPEEVAREMGISVHLLNQRVKEGIRQLRGHLVLRGSA